MLTTWQEHQQADPSSDLEELLQANTSVKIVHALDCHSTFTFPNGMTVTINSEKQVICAPNFSNIMIGSPFSIRLKYNGRTIYKHDFDEPKYSINKNHKICTNLSLQKKLIDNDVIDSFLKRYGLDSFSSFLETDHKLYLSFLHDKLKICKDLLHYYMLTVLFYLDTTNAPNSVKETIPESFDLFLDTLTKIENYHVEQAKLDLGLSKWLQEKQPKPKASSPKPQKIDQQSRDVTAHLSKVMPSIIERQSVLNNFKSSLLSTQETIAQFRSTSLKLLGQENLQQKQADLKTLETKIKHLKKELHELNYLPTTSFHPRIVKESRQLNQTKNQLIALANTVISELKGQLSVLRRNEKQYSEVSEIFFQGLLDTRKIAINKYELLAHIKNPNLKDIINELYREGARFGDGGTAFAIFYESTTGELIDCERGHIFKGIIFRQALEHLLETSDLPPMDEHIAQHLLDDLNEAIHYHFSNRREIQDPSMSQKPEEAVAVPQFSTKPKKRKKKKKK